LTEQDFFDDSLKLAIAKFQAIHNADLESTRTAWTAPRFNPNSSVANADTLQLRFVPPQKIGELPTGASIFAHFPLQAIFSIGFVPNFF
jgi:hypothetical protein